jgi:glycosyltransferase involved in cell wall biosynthesis
MISIVMPAFNEEKAVGKVIDGFRTELALLGLPFEFVVVDNNSTDGTSRVALEHGARVVHESQRGYGYACIRALKEAKGDIVFLTESDNTFDPKDIWKALVYLDEEVVDFVLGTRTTLELVERGAKMDWFLHWGNIFLAKLIQVQFWGRVRLTDVGCTFRAIKRSSLLRIVDKLSEGGSCFSPEMIIRCLKIGLRSVEIPVKYLERTGQSKITVNRKKSFIIGLGMIRLIITQNFWRDHR